MNPQNNNPGPLTNTNSQPMQPPPPVELTAPQPKKKPRSKGLVGILIILVFISSLAGAYALGRNSKKPAVVTNQTPFKTLSLPPEAIVAAECEPGRGKQYIIPKDIPKGGPLYDVNNNRVIAIEYLIKVQDLLTKPDSLTDKITDLTKNYQVDHFSIVPTAPHAGENSQHIHLIMFVVSKDEAKTITCGQSSSDATNSEGTTEEMMHMH